MQSVGSWHPVINLKELNAHIYAPHFRMHTISSVLSTIKKGDYAFKIDLQDANFHVLVHPDSRKYLCFCIQKQGIPVLSTSLQSEHCPSDIYSSGAHSGSLSPSSGDILDIQFLGLQLREILAHVCQISSHKFLSYTQVSQFMRSLNWASGLNAFCHLHLRLLQ